MLFYFLLTILVDHRLVEAAPLFAYLDKADSSQDSNAPLHRTLFGIIWSCFSTIIICAWTSVHPNVPPPNLWKARWNRLKLMFWMIVAPELVLAWAVRQCFAAKEIRDEFNKRQSDFPRWKKWTLKHGHFFEMGGFILFDPDQKDRDPDERIGVVLTFDYFKEHPEIDSHIPEITASEIEDKSKGDALSKVIAILQTTWFIVQCIARWQQRLALTELELVTLALASLNAVTFGIWWYKPLGVQEPVKIYVKNTGIPEVDNAPRNEDISFETVIEGRKVFQDFGFFVIEVFQHSSRHGCGVFVLVPLVLTYIITLPVFVLFPLGAVFLLRIIKTEPGPKQTSQSRGLLAARIVTALQNFRYTLTSFVSKFVEKTMEDILEGAHDGFRHGLFTGFLFSWYILLPCLFLFLVVFLILLIPFFAILFLVSFIFTAVFGIVTTSSIRPGASHVPSFYAPSTQSDRWSRMVVFALFGVTFGGLHCIGWNFDFPTHSEQTLWRATSLAITVIPPVVAPVDFLLGIRDVRSCGRFEKIGLLTMDLIMTVFLFIYVPARLSLIAQALSLLRNQPASALTAVDWTKYVPHLFSS